MKPDEVATFYLAVMDMDSRNRELSKMGAKLWAQILKDVPFRESEALLLELYSTHRMSVLQPGDVVEAWDAIKSERRRLVERINSIDRYMLIEDDPTVIAEKEALREELVAQLPVHVVEYANVGQRQLEPPPKYPKKEREVQVLELGSHLKSV